MKEIVIYLLAINLITFIAMGIDKAKSKRGSRRIPEKRLFLLAILGGALGGVVAMKAWRHKTKHAAFVIGFPSILIINIVCVYCVIQLQ